MPQEFGKPWPNGMYSRRHQTSEAYMQARATQDANNEQQMGDLMSRQAAARTRTPQDQIKRLDSLLGKGQGAVRERARLSLKVAAATEAATTVVKQTAHKVENKAKKAKKAKKGGN